MKGLKPYIILLRPHHWIKNLFLFAAPFFGGVIFKEGFLKAAIPAFFAFSFAASAVYIFNDIIDKQRDRLHPLKNKRPIASGAVEYKMAILIALFLLFLSLYISFKIEKGFFLYVVFYLLLQIAYSLKLKNIAILDIFCIAAGFVIRVMAGGRAFHIEVSPWLFATMFMISLVLASGKRLSETRLLHDSASNHRKSLNDYSEGFLKDILIISSGTAIVTYALYTVEQSQELIFTIPVVVFGLFRYLRLANSGTGDATEALTKDLQLAIAVIIWLGLVGIIRH